MYRRFTALALLLALGATGLRAEDEKPKPVAPDLVAELRQGGFNIFFRHGLTPNYKDALDTDVNDPRPGDCSYQRNLSAEGIAQSQATGDAIRALDIPVGIVRSSPMCRSMDSAWYAFGRYERDYLLKLNGTNPDVDVPERRIWNNIRQIAEIPPLPGTNSFFMSHGTVGEVFGAGYLDEGEAVIVKPDGKGGWTLVARVKANQWGAQ